MMKIRFHETFYKLLNDPYVNSTRFQARFEKGDNTFDSIIADTLDTEEITVYDDDDEATGLYTGYSSRVALYIIGESNEISVEFDNPDIQTQINALTNRISNTEDSISSLDSGITELADEIAVLNETQESQDAAIEELAEVINS